MTGRPSIVRAASFSVTPPRIINRQNMNRNRFEPDWAARPARDGRPKTAVDRIDEYLQRDREPYDREAINRALRIVFGDAPEGVQPHQYEP
jgi:hypothetical protein